MILSDNDRKIATFTMLGHAIVHWFELAIPILLVVWLSVFDISVALIGLLVALGYAPFGLGALPAGLLADCYGPKSLILVCLIGMSAAFVMLAFAPSIYAIAGCLLAWGIFASIYHPAGLALISTSADDRGTVFAWHGIAGNVGIALGPFATATLLLFFEWRVVAVVLAIPGLFAAIYGLRLEFDLGAIAGSRNTDTTRPRAESQFFTNSFSLFSSSFLVVFAIVTFVGLYYRGMLTYLPELLNTLPRMAVAEPPIGLEGFSLGEYFYVSLLVAGMAGQYVGGKLTNRIPVEHGLIAIFLVLTILALIFVPITEMQVMIILLYCGVLGFSLFAIEPFYQEAVAVYSPPSMRGLSYGYTYLGMFGLGSVSIAIGGFILDYMTMMVFFVVLSTIALIGAVVTLKLVSNSSQNNVEPSDPEPVT